MKTIAIIVGSSRRQAFSKSVAMALQNILKAESNAEFLQIDNLTMFNQDYDDDGTTPETWTAFRQKLLACDAIVFVTPEYNRSIPPLLKNAVDIGSRPAGKNVWSNKPCAIVSSSTGKIGGALSNQDLKKVLGFLNAKIMHQPEAYVGEVTSLIDENGVITNKNTLDFLSRFVAAFIKFIS